MNRLAQGHTSEWLATWDRTEPNFLSVSFFVLFWPEMSINKVINLGFL